MSDSSVGSGGAARGFEALGLRETLRGGGIYALLGGHPPKIPPIWWGRGFLRIPT